MRNAEKDVGNSKAGARGSGNPVAAAPGSQRLDLRSQHAPRRKVPTVRKRIIMSSSKDMCLR